MDNDEVIENEVPEETSEENLEEVKVTDNASEGEEQNQEEAVEPNTSDEDIEKEIEKRANERTEKQIQSRLRRQERKFNEKLSKYEQLENVMKAGLNVDNLDDAISAASQFYQDQGVTIPEYRNSRSERDEKVLAKADAQDIIELGHDEMEAEANRLAGIPNRSLREETIFNTLCEKLIEDRQVNELKEKGIDTEILDNKDFQAFKSQFNYNTPISNIYDMYMLKNKPAEKPVSAGSAKSESTTSGDTFSPQRINEMSQEEMLKYWDNPAFRKAAGLN